MPSPPEFRRMGIYDQAARYATRLDPDAVLSRLFADAGIAVTFVSWFDTRAMPLPGGPDRTAGIVAVAEEVVDDAERVRPAPVLVVMEMQTRHEEGKIDRGTKRARSTEARRGQDRRLVGGSGRLPQPDPRRSPAHRVLTAMVYLTGTCPERESSLSVAGFGWSHRPLIWDVSADLATTALDDVEADRASWGLLAWVPLMAGADSAELYRRWDEVLTAKMTYPQTREMIRRLAKIFSELKGTVMIWDTTNVAYPTESPMVNEWIDTGRIDGQRESIITGLRARFPGPLTESVVEVVRAQTSPELIHRWVETSYRAASIEEFIAAMRG